ncbi:hypothetical protein MUK42_34980 [Musa troglodytarum]|uniref:Uncharacterized protein n=1 Tax=Musa troglodytarum TaxID=320322 RepID=A0A9E7GXM2_9LILI|nr:hypothetical protein MUK42_34980 [Musa troglodytarum]
MFESMLSFTWFQVLPFLFLGDAASSLFATIGFCRHGHSKRPIVFGDSPLSKRCLLLLISLSHSFSEQCNSNLQTCLDVSGQAF